MRLYLRGHIWWIEVAHSGSKARISLHTSDKQKAESVLREMEAARSQSKRSAKTRSLLSIVEVICCEYGASLADLAKMLGSNVSQPQNTDSDTIGTPLSQIWDIYEDTAKSCALLPGESTIYKRMTGFSRFETWVAKTYPSAETAESISGRIAAAYAKHLADSGLKTKTRKNLLGDLGAIWRILSKQIDGLVNPWANLSPRDTDGTRGEAFTRDEEEAVLEAAKEIGKDWYPVCMVMRHTGLRYGDVARLKWSEIDLKRNVMNVIPNKTSRKQITVSPAIIPAVAEALSALPRGDEYVFPLHAKLYGNRGRQSREQLNFREVLNIAGISRHGITVHSWRHTAASRLAEAGVDKDTRKRLLGHTVDDTADRYDHADHAAENLAAQMAAAK